VPRGYTFKSMVVVPREMQVESDISDLPVQQADPEVEALLAEQENKRKEAIKQKEEKAAEALKTAEAALAAAKEGGNETAIKGAEEALQTATLVLNTTVANATNASNASNASNTTVVEDAAKEFTNETHPLSHEFNTTFKVEASSHAQADQLLSAVLKKQLLEHPKFLVDFQEDQIMIYREYTMEPDEYSEAVKLGAALLEHLPDLLAVEDASAEEAKVDEEGAEADGKKADDKKMADLDMTVFVSKTEL